MAPLALVVDYGGVLTSTLATTMAAWCEADGIEPTAFLDVLREWQHDHAGEPPMHALETGDLSVPEFEKLLAARLRTVSGIPVAPEGLLARMFAGFEREATMVDVVRRARAAGVRTALLSNSWGMNYPRDEWAELFDTVVISGEVGLRKPDAAIYLMTAQRLGVEPEDCVFVDDLPGNVRGATAVGMIGVRHIDPATTVTELEALFEVRLAG